MLCERGIRTFESYTRNTLDISAIPVVQKLSHLPVDRRSRATAPAGATRSAPMARAAVAAGADGLIIEVHCDPDHAKSDGAQSMFPAAVRAADGRAAHHRAGDRPQHLRGAGRAARLEPLSRHVRSGDGSAVCARRHRRPRVDRRIGRPRACAAAWPSVCDRRRRLGADRAKPRVLERSSTNSETRRRALADSISSCSPRPSSAIIELIADTRQGRVSTRRHRRRVHQASRDRGRGGARGWSNFVGGHPMAGGERGGLDAARADLFRGKPWFLSPASTRIARGV